MNRPSDHDGVDGMEEITARVIAGVAHLPSEAELREAAPDLWIEYDKHFPDPRRPVITRLIFAVVCRLAYLNIPKYWSPKPWPKSLPPRPPELEKQITEDYAVLSVSRFARIQEEISELLDCIVGPVTPSQRTEALGPFADSLRSRGMAMQHVINVIDVVKELRIGRPITKRLAAVRALEMKLLDPGLSWSTIHTRVYVSGTENHLSRPADHLSSEVRVLKRLLRKYGVPVD